MSKVSIREYFTVKKRFVVLAIMVFVVLIVTSQRNLSYKMHDFGYSERARKNLTLAAEKFLAQQGFEASSHMDYAFLRELLNVYSKHWIDEDIHVNDLAREVPAKQRLNVGLSVQDTIVLMKGTHLLNHDQIEQLWRWVQAGGTLVATASPRSLVREKNPFDSLLDRLNIHEYDDSKVAAQPQVESQPPKEESPDEALPLNKASENIQVLDLNHEEVRVHFSEPVSFYENTLFNEDTGSVDVFPQRIWQHTIDRQVSRDYPHDADVKADHWVAAAYRLGEGKIWVHADNNFWRNQWIAQEDHAYYLLHILGVDRLSESSRSMDKGRVWFFYINSVPSLPWLLWWASPFAVITLIGFLLLGLYRAKQRFGPVYSPEMQLKNDFVQHLHASAKFIWQRGSKKHLSDSIWEAFYRECRRRIPSFERMSQDEKVTSILQITDHKKENIEVLLSKDHAFDEAQLIELITIFKKIKAKL